MADEQSPAQKLLEEQRRQAEARRIAAERALKEALARAAKNEKEKR